MATTLVTSQYVLPGSYLGRIYTPNAGTLSGDPRQPCFVGKGNRLAIASNIPIRRAFLTAQVVPFPTTVPHQVTLTNVSDGDQTLSTLYTQSGAVIPTSKWAFSKSAPSVNGYDTITILPESFSATSTYYLDYQTINRNVTDDLPFDEIRQVVRVGDYQDQAYYNEQEAFYLRTTTTDPSEGTVATTTTDFTPVQQTSGLGAATPNMNAGATYTGNHNRHYRFEVVSLAPLTFLVDITNEGGGNNLTPDYPVGPNISGLTFSVAVAGQFDLDVQMGLTSLSVLVDIDPGEAFALNDVFEFNALGPAVIELDPAYSNTNQFSSVSALTASSGNLGTASMTLNPGSEFTGDTNKDLKIECASFSGSSPNRTATFDYQLYGADGITKGSILINEFVTGNLTNRTVAEGIAVDFSFGADVTAGNASFALAAGTITLTSALPLFTSAMVGQDIIVAGATTPGNNGTFVIASYVNPTTITYLNVAGATEVGAGTWTVESFYKATSAAVQGDVWTTSALAPMLYYTGKDDRTYDLTVTAATSVANTSVTGVAVAPTNTFDVATDVTTALATHPTIRIEGSTGNDNLYTLQSTSYDSGTDTTTVTVVEAVASAIADGTMYYGDGTSNLFYTTGTPEGRFGTLSLLDNDTVSPLADQVKFYVRNSGNPLLIWDANNNRNTVTDTWSFTTTNDDELDWSLVARETETISVANLREDTIGSITGSYGGIAGTKYVILRNTPTAQPLRVWTTNPTTGVVTELTISTTPTFVGGSDAYWIDGTPYIFFPTAPTEPISVTYEHRAKEPDPGQVYYITAYYLRPANLYNNPIRLLNADSAIEALGPMYPDNDLLIMALIALEDCNAFAVWVTQVKDTDDDGVYTDYDFEQAIESTEMNDQLTDITVLQNFGSLSKLKTSVIAMNDPFERKGRLAWVGAPVGTAIGDTDTPDTLVFLAKHTLQVYGENPAHGAFILVGNTVCEKTIELAEGTQATVTLDGSFVAGAASALVSSYTDPAETILRKDQPGFDRIGGETIDVQYEEKELKLLGAAGVSTLQEVGSDVYQWVEDITVDTFAQDTQQINAMTQKNFVERYVRSRMDTSITGIVAPSAQSGVAIVKGFLVELLRSLKSRGILAPWTDEEGNERDLDPQSDVVVFRDETDRTLYHYKFWFNIRYPIKRTFGLYSVDTKSFTPLTTG